MNEANLDHLLQVTPNRANWGPAGPAIGRGELPAFDDHLTQASTPRAPVEPPRLRDARPTERAPSASSLPSKGEADRAKPDEDNTADSAAQTPAADTDEQKDNQAEEASTSNVASGERVATDDEANTTLTERSESDPRRDEEIDDNNEELATELTVVTVNADAVDLQRSLEPTTGVGTATPTDGSESTDSNAKELSQTHQRPASDETQLATAVTPVKGSAIVEVALSAGAQSQQVDIDREQAVLPIPTKATAEVEIGVAKPAAEAIVHSSPHNTKADHTVATSKQQHFSSREAISTSGRTDSVHREEAPTTDAPPRTERTTKKVENTSDEVRESTSARPSAGRNGSRFEAPTSFGNVPLAVSVGGATPADAIQEAAKSDATEESARPAAPIGTRSDALLHPLARLHRGGAMISRSHRDANAEDLPPVDPARFVSRVAKAFQAAQERGGALQLRLSPPELGSLRLELLVQDGVLAAKLEAETPAARRVLLDHLPALRDRLAEQNIRIERFDVDVRQEGGGHSPSSPQHGRDQRPHHDSPHRQPPRQPAQSSEPIPAAPAAGPITDSQINLVA